MSNSWPVLGVKRKIMSSSLEHTQVCSVVLCSYCSTQVVSVEKMCTQRPLLLTPTTQLFSFLKALGGVSTEWLTRGQSKYTQTFQTRRQVSKMGFFPPTMWNTSKIQSCGSLGFWSWNTQTWMSWQCWVSVVSLNCSFSVAKKNKPRMWCTFVFIYVVFTEIDTGSKLYTQHT